MGDSIKRVIITGDATGLEQALESAAGKSGSLYERLSRDAQTYTNDLRSQQIYIERMLALEQRRIEQELRRERQTQTNLSKDSSILGRARNERSVGFTEGQISFYETKRQEIIEARAEAKSGFERRKLQRSQETEYEDVSDRPSNFGGRVAGGVKRGAGAVASGLGIGVGLGIFGILYEMVNQATILEKSMKGVTSVMSGLDQTSLSTANSLGKTTSEMAQITREFAVSTGGMYGASGIGSRSRFGVMFEKSFSLGDGTINQQAGAFRMSGGKDLVPELYTLVKDLNQSGYIRIKKGDNDFTKMAEAMTYYGRLNDMQTRQMGVIDPSTSSKMIATLFATGIPGMNDQRVMGKMEGLNTAIASPGNDFTQAFTMRALAGISGGGYLNTKMQQEKGIFGKGNLKAIFQSLIGDIGGGGNLLGEGQDQYGIKNLSTGGERVALGLQTFAKGAFTFEDSKRLIAHLGSMSPEKREEFFNAFGSSQTDKDSQKTVEETLKKAGIKGGLQGLAGGNIGLKERLVAGFNDIMANTGDKALEPIRKLIGKDGSAIAQSAETMGMVASATMNLAVGNFATAVKQFADIFGGDYNDRPIVGGDATEDSKKYNIRGGNRVLKSGSKEAMQWQLEQSEKRLKKFEGSSANPEDVNYDYGYELEMRRNKKLKERIEDKPTSSNDIQRLIEKMDEVAVGISEGNKQRSEGNKYLLKGLPSSANQQLSFVS